MSLTLAARPLPVMAGVKIAILSIWLTIHRQNALLRAWGSVDSRPRGDPPHVRRTAGLSLMACTRFFRVACGVRLDGIAGGLLGKSSRLGLLAERPVTAHHPYWRRQGQGGSDSAIVSKRQRRGRRAIMRNAAEMALAEFNNPDLQLLVKDDGGSAPGAQQATQQALDEGAEIILGPLFALTVGPVGRAARARGVPVIAFSTDTNVAARGVYLLSFLPESDVDRIIGYAASQGRRSFAALVPDNAYGSVAEAAFKQ